MWSRWSPRRGLCLLLVEVRGTVVNGKYNLFNTIIDDSRYSFCLFVCCNTFYAGRDKSIASSTHHFAFLRQYPSPSILDVWDVWPTTWAVNKQTAPGHLQSVEYSGSCVNSLFEMTGEMFKQDYSVLFTIEGLSDKNDHFLLLFYPMLYFSPIETLLPQARFRHVSSTHLHACKWSRRKASDYHHNAESEREWDEPRCFHQGRKQSVGNTAVCKSNHRI